MPFRGWLACALGACAIGCGDSGGGDLSALFEALNGDYQVREESDCVIAIRGSRFETRTSTGNTTCSETYTYEDGSEGETEVLRVSGTLSDTRISGTLFNEEAWSLGLDPNCETREGFRHEIRASADKRSGRTAAGRFEGLAGVWEGEVELLEYNFVQECDAAEERYDERATRYSFTADVSGDSIDVTYSKGGDPEAFEVLSSSSGDLLVDGELVRFESE